MLCCAAGSVIRARLEIGLSVRKTVTAVLAQASSTQFIIWWEDYAYVTDTAYVIQLVLSQLQVTNSSNWLQDACSHILGFITWDKSTYSHLAITFAFQSFIAYVEEDLTGVCSLSHSSLLSCDKNVLEKE